MAEVVVYSQEGCPPCAQVKAFLTELGVPFQVKDVARDRQALAEFQRLGFRGTPVTVIDGQAIVGFDPPRLQAALRSRGGTGREPVRIVW